MEDAHVCNEGWICEAHPELGWPHTAAEGETVMKDGDCPGPGMPCQYAAAQAERDGGYPYPAPECGGTDKPQWDKVIARV